MRVPLVGAGTHDDPVRPDVPDGVRSRVVEWHDDGTVTVEVDPGYQAASTALAARISVVDKVRAGELDDATIAGLVGIFPPWTPDLDVTTGEVYTYDGTLVEALQTHTTQNDWTPPATPALWKIHRTDNGDVPLAWMPGLALTTDDQVTYDGVTYNVVQAHTTQAGWLPPDLPSLYTPA